MQYVCDAPGRKTWFRLETQAEADAESALLEHAVDKHFRRARDAAVQAYRPTSPIYIEQEIGLKAHVQRAMPLFLTLRDGEGNGLATAMLPAGGKDDGRTRSIVVGPRNADPYPTQGDAIAALATHFDLPLDRARCYPYGR